MKNFEDNIKDLIKNSVQIKDKTTLRTRVLNRIAEERFLGKVFTVVSKEVRLNSSSKAIMKEKLMLIASATNSFNFNGFFKPLFNRQVFAFFTLILFFVGFIMQPFTEVGSVKAYAPPKITTYSGSVIVERDGEVLRVFNDFVLEENDIIQTGPAGFVEVIFSDNSLARLTTDTRLRLRQIDNRIVNSATELSLQSGGLWVNTLGLTGSQADFTVHLKDLSVSTSTNSVFDLRLTQEYARVVSLSETLNLSLYHNENYIPTTLRKGNLVKVRKETQYTTYLDQLTFQNRLHDFDLDWLVSNFRQDEFYIDSLSRSRIAELEKIAGITPDSYFYPVKEFRRAARLAMTFNPIRQAELELMYANQRMIEAEVLFERGNSDTAKATLVSSTNSLNRAAKRVAQIGTTEDDSVAKLKVDLADSIVLQKRALGEVLPVEEKEETRNVINEAERLLASNSTELRKIELNQLNELLDEIKTLIENENNELAEQKLATYLDNLLGLSDNLEYLAESEAETLILTLIDSNFSTLKKISKLSDQKAEDAVVIEEDELESDLGEHDEVKAESDSSEATIQDADISLNDLNDENEKSKEKSIDIVDFNANDLSREDLNKLLEQIETKSRSNLEKALELAEQIKNPAFRIELNRLNTLINSSLEDLIERSDVLIEDINLTELLQKSVEMKD